MGSNSHRRSRPPATRNPRPPPRRRRKSGCRSTGGSTNRTRRAGSSSRSSRTRNWLRRQTSSHDSSEHTTRSRERSVATGALSKFSMSPCSPPCSTPVSRVKGQVRSPGADTTAGTQPTTPTIPTRDRSNRQTRREAGTQSHGGRLRPGRVTETDRSCNRKELRTRCASTTAASRRPSAAASCYRWCCPLEVWPRRRWRRPRLTRPSPCAVSPT